ncbi:MAG: hypothetical protein REI11_04615 [Patulibacter sp.]|nr:hypothetical protein [Patulibacter sp.]
MANDHARRLRNFLSSLTGQVSGLEALDIDAIRALLTEGERAQLQREASAAIAGLRTLNRNLENGQGA